MPLASVAGRNVYYESYGEAKGNPLVLVMGMAGSCKGWLALQVPEFSDRHRTLIFAFGIGAGVSEHLVRGVARASGGAAEFVHPGERIEEKVLRHFVRIAAGASGNRLSPRA